MAQVTYIEPIVWEEPTEVDIRSVFKTDAKITYDPKEDNTTVWGDLSIKPPQYEIEIPTIYISGLITTCGSLNLYSDYNLEGHR
jgi:hypothetical protein